MVLYEWLVGVWGAGGHPSVTLVPGKVNLTSPVTVCCVTTLIFGLVYWRKVKTKCASVSRTAPPMVESGGPEVVVVGSGVLGSALAATLSRDGRNVTVIERRMAMPDRMVGELLQPGGRRALEALGLQDCTESIDAHTIKGYVIHDVTSGSEVHVPYPSDARGRSEEGRAFHHGRFVMALRHAAQRQKNATYIEGTASELIEENGSVVGVRYREENSEKTQEVRAALTVIADGCFSRFRRDLVSPRPTVRSTFVGMVMENCPQCRPNHAEVVLTDLSPVLVYQISSRETRVLVDVKGAMPRDVKQYMKDVVYPQIPEHLQAPFHEAIENGRIRSMPNSFLPPGVVDKPGVLLLGDALNMRHPLTGGGMSVALSDVLLWRHLLADIPNLGDQRAVLKAQRAFHVGRKNAHAFVVNVLAMALYELFSADDEYLRTLKVACFDYFKLGGECVNGPVGLLSVLTPKPHLLVGHFLAVALYAVYRTIRAGRWWGAPRALLTSARVLYAALAVLVPLIWSEWQPAERH